MKTIPLFILLLFSLFTITRINLSFIAKASEGGENSKAKTFKLKYINCLAPFEMLMKRSLFKREI